MGKGTSVQDLLEQIKELQKENKDLNNTILELNKLKASTLNSNNEAHAREIEALRHDLNEANERAAEYFSKNEELDKSLKEKSDLLDKATIEVTIEKLQRYEIIRLLNIIFDFSGSVYKDFNLQNPAELTRAIGFLALQLKHFIDVDKRTLAMVCARADDVEVLNRARPIISPN